MQATICDRCGRQYAGDTTYSVWTARTINHADHENAATKRDLCKFCHDEISFFIKLNPLPTDDDM